MLKIKILSILILTLISLDVFASNLKKDIANRNEELTQIKNNINKKKQEKYKLVKQEKEVQKDLQKISASINNNQKKLNNLQNKIKETNNNLQIATQNSNKATIEKKQSLNVIEDQYIKYNKQKLTQYKEDPFELKIRKISLYYNVQEYDKANSKLKEEQSNISKYSKQNDKLVNLKDKETQILNKNKQLQENKNKLLQDTSKKRLAKEKEIKELDSSAMALKELINKLSKQSVIQKSKKKPIKSLRSNSNKRRNNLPWPVDGKIITNYGKNKHSTLNTTVISNGIKIKTNDNSVVKSVDKGVVVFTGEFRSYGKMIIVDHNGVFFSVYSQLSKILVSDNQKIEKQQEIALLGKGDKAVLYFEIRQCNVCENPILWLKEK